MATSHELTAAEQAGLAELKERMECIWAADDSSRQSEWTLVRFLRARKLVVHDAFVALMKYVQWLTTPDYGVQTIAEITEAMCGPHPAAGTIGMLDGTDRAGRPVMYVEIAQHVAAKCDVTEFTRYIIFRCKQAEERLEALPAAVHQYTVLINLVNFSVSDNWDGAATKRALYVLTNFYPERLAQCLIINSPLAFRGCWAILSPWLDPVTREKMLFLPLSELTERIEEGSLPPALLAGGDTAEITSNAMVQEGEGKE